MSTFKHLSCTKLLATAVFAFVLLFGYGVNAEVATPGNISSCPSDGTLTFASDDTYNITGNIGTTESPCHIFITTGNADIVNIGGYNVVGSVEVDSNESTYGAWIGDDTNWGGVRTWVFNGGLNSGTVTGNATFKNNNENNGGTVRGNATFNDTTDNVGLITGNATFNDQSFNGGDINGSAYFTASSFDSNRIPNADPTCLSIGCHIGNGAYFTSTSSVTFTLHNGDYWNMDATSLHFTTPGAMWVFNDISTNRSTVLDATFNDDSFNDGGTVSGDATFNNRSFNNNNITGNATFNDYSINNGGCTVSGDATFNGNSENDGLISSDATFNDYSINDNNITGNATFNNYSYNGGIVTGDATFNNNSENNYGTISGNATFNGTSDNNSVVSGNATFNDSSPNYGIVEKEANFYASSTNVDGSGVVNGVANVYYPHIKSLGGMVTSGIINYIGYLGGLPGVEFTGAAGDGDWNTLSNWLDVNGDQATELPDGSSTVTIDSGAGVGTGPHGGYDGDVIVNGSIVGGTFNGNVTLNNSSNVDCAGGCTFNGDVTFNDNSLVYEGAFYGAVTFNSGTMIQGGDFSGATSFTDNGATWAIYFPLNLGPYSTSASIEVINNYGPAESIGGGTYTGTITFDSGDSSISNSDISGATLIADGVVVTDNGGNTYVGTTFSTLNGGSFIGFIITSGPGYYFNDSEGDGDWGNILNWTNVDGDKAATLPTSADSVVMNADVSSDSSDSASASDIDFNGYSNTGATITVSGIATFRGYTYNGGTINGPVAFYDSSYNGGTVSGDATFNSQSENDGLISSDATFNDNSINNGGSVSGTATFNNYSYNAGTVEVGVFNGDSFNAGAVTGTATYGGLTGRNSIHDGFYYVGGEQTTLDSVGDGIWNGGYYEGGSLSSNVTIDTNANTVLVDGIDFTGTYGDSNTVWTFQNGASNSGNITGTVSFLDSSYNSSSGYIDGNAIFNPDSNPSASSYNDGEISGTADVYSPAQNPLGGTVDSGVINYYGYDAVFNDSVDIGGDGNGEWNDTNNWWTDETYSTHPAAIPDSNTSVTVISDIKSDSSSSASASTVTFTGTSSNGISINTSSTTVFTDSSSNGVLQDELVDITVGGSYAEIEGWGGGTIDLGGAASFTYDDVKNSVGSWNNANQGAVKLASYMDSYYPNYGDTPSGIELTGFSGSTLSFTVSPTSPYKADWASDNGSSYSISVNQSSSGGAAGSVSSDAVFLGDSSDITNGSVSGSVTRKYTENTITTRNFVTEGGRNDWIITAYNSVVNLAGATYNRAANIFKAFTNSIFQTNPNIDGGASVTPELTINSPVVGTNIKFKPDISWGNAQTCEYQIDGGDYTGVSCTEFPTISKPSAGSHILFFRATDSHGNLTEKSVSFTYNNTQPVDTDCSTPLDEARPYYLTATTSNTCTATANVTLKGNASSTIPGFTLNGNFISNGNSITFQNITVSGTIYGNATFDSTSYNLGTVLGNAQFNAYHANASSTVTVSNNPNFQGTGKVSGTIKDASGNLISSWNLTSGTLLQGVLIGQTTLSGTAQNNGTIMTSATTTFMGDMASSSGEVLSQYVNRYTGNFVALGQTNGGWRGITSTSNGDIYATVWNGDIYKQTGGTGNFVALGQTNRAWFGITSTPNGDIYATVDGGDIYKQTGGTGNFVALGQTNRGWLGITSIPNGDIYAIVWNGDIYKQTGGTGNFVALGQTNRGWRGITSTSNGDIYAIVDGGDIYKQTGGTGNFVALGQTNGGWRGITSTSNGDIYATVNGGDIYKQTGGTGNFVALGQTNRAWRGITSTPNGDIYATVWYGDIYKMSPNNPLPQSTSSPIVRIFTSAASTTRNFLTEAGHNNWVLIAQGVVVDISNAIYDTATNIFKALTGGLFTENSSMSGGAHVVPKIIITNPTSGTNAKWAPQINWDTATSTNGGGCYYSYDNFATVHSLNCASGGSDLPKPISHDNNGNLISYTLVLRGIDSKGNIAETSPLTFKYDNTLPVSTDCSTPLDEASRPYYYLSGNVVGDCHITVNTELRGTTTSATKVMTNGFKVTGNIIADATSTTGNGLNITLTNITVTGTTTANGGSSGGSGGSITIKNAKVGTLAANGATYLSGNGGNGGVITVGTSTTGTVYSNGGDGSGNGGAGGVVTIVNAYGTPFTTPVYANGGDSKSCGNGGDNGDITLRKSLYGTLKNLPGNGDNTGCASDQKHNYGSSGNSAHGTPVVDGTYTRTGIEDNSDWGGVPYVAPGDTTTTANTSDTGSSRSSGGTTLAPIFTVLPPVTKLTPIKLTPIPTFGDTTTKKSFSLGEGISTFLFAPLPTTVTTSLGKDLTTYLKTLGFSKEQDLVTIQKKPILLPKATSTIPGLFTVTTKGLPIKTLGGDFTTDNTLPVSTYLTTDKKTNLVQKLTTTPNTQITITLKGGKTATWNNQTLTFTNNTLTLTTPSKPGTYTLSTPSSPLALVIEVPNPNKVTTPTEAPKASWFNKLLNYFF